VVNAVEPSPLILFHLRIPDEHLDDVIVETVIELPLEIPGELRTLDLPRLKMELIAMDFHPGWP
jgi:hypothetical protein